MNDGIPAANPATPFIPPIGKRSFIDFQDVRDFIFDRQALDNPLLMDLEFSDDEISSAQRRAAMYYNEMQPQVEIVQPASLPFGMIFLYGIIYFLQMGKLQQLARNNVEYTAGNMEVDINKKRIEFLTESVKMFRDEFNRLALDRKTTINIQQGYASF